MKSANVYRQKEGAVTVLRTENSEKSKNIPHWFTNTGKITVNIGRNWWPLWLTLALVSLTLSGGHTPHHVKSQ